jgi:hypothetical protein
MSSLSSGKLEDIKYLYENVVINDQEVLSEGPRDLGTQLRDITGAGLQGIIGQQTTSTNPLARGANAFQRGITEPFRQIGDVAGAQLQGAWRGEKTTSTNPLAQAANAYGRGGRDFATGLLGIAPSPKEAGIRGTSTGGRPPGTGTSAKTTPSAPAAPGAAPAGPVLSKRGGVEGTGVGANFKPGAWSAAEKSRYAAQAAKTSPGANSAMNQWAKANPNLAAAAAERARTRGTQQTDNPLMRDMRSRLPANTPSVQSPAVSQLGAGNQSLSKNPNAFRAAPERPATPTAPIRPVTPTAAINAASSTSPAASGSVVPATNRLAAATRPTPMIPTRMPLRQSYEYEDVYDVILEYLIDEGYAETVEQAEVIMVNMSEGWRESIVEAREDNL